MAKNSKSVQLKADEKRSRNININFYPEDLPDDWKERIDSLGIKWILSPLHDQDYNADGTPKKAHHHAMFLNSNKKTVKQMMDELANLFGVSPSGSVIGVPHGQLTIDRTATVRYMAHLDHPDKAQYPAEEIQGRNGADVMDILKRSRTETLNVMIAMEEYIERNRIIELCDFSKAIRYEHQDWYEILTTKNTTYFRAYMASRRHAQERSMAEPDALPDGASVDPETGEIIFNDESV